MSKAVIDIGNTKIKSAIFHENGEIKDVFVDESFEKAYQNLKNNGANSILCANVGEEIPRIDDPQLILLNPNTLLPFQNRYTSQETLGLDRLAAMAAAVCLYPEQPVLVFDIGTCMTIDFMHPDGQYKGGNISPGIQMRLKALHSQTARLPLVNVNEAQSDMGISTRTAIASGVLSGMKHEIIGYHRQYSEQYPSLITVLCGGDSMHFDIPSKNKIFAAPNFVLQGLYHLLLLNEK